MATISRPHTPRMEPGRRTDERVSPLELFFDLVFVLALTQCTALMAGDPTWSGLGKALVILGMLWWAWVGYAWLTSVVDPLDGVVRVTVFAAMAALLVVALCIDDAFGHLGLLFAGAYGVVRTGQIVLFSVASRNDPPLRKSVNGLAVSTAVAVALLTGAYLANGTLQGALWVTALTLDMAGPFFFGIEGWKLVPGHFAERHGLIVIIALGESIVAIGVGAEAGVDAGVVAAAVLGVAVAAALWWLYFDPVAFEAEQALSRAETGRERNALARDSFSYLHLPMVAGIVLLALGLKKTLQHVEDPLELVPAVAMLGGTALYLLALVGFRLRVVQEMTIGWLVAAIALAALIPVAVEVTALTTLAVLSALLAVLIAYERRRFATQRTEMRSELEGEATPS